MTTWKVSAVSGRLQLGSELRLAALHFSTERIKVVELKENSLERGTIKPDADLKSALNPICWPHEGVN